MDIPEKISTNRIYAGIHWTKRKKLADLYHMSLLPYRKHKIQDYPVNINYIFTFKSKPLDTTNCTFMAKMLEDGLVANGIIEDDDIKHVTFTGIYSQEGTHDLVEITIT